MGGTTRNRAKFNEICGIYASQALQEPSTRLYSSKSLGIRIISDSLYKLAHISLSGLANDDGDSNFSADVDSRSAALAVVEANFICRLQDSW